MPNFAMRAMWPWLAVAALAAVTCGDPLPSTTVLPPDPAAEHPLPEPADKEVQALESAAVEDPSTRDSRLPDSQANVPNASIVQSKAPAREPKLTPGREPKLMERDRENRHRTLDRAASELAWKNWLQSPESRDPGAPPRRITPKSVFIAPSNCPEGRKIGEGCVSVHHVGKEVHDQYILEQLNNRGSQGGGGVEYDYDEESASTGDGPLQLNLPLGPAFAAAASQNIITSVPANEKKDGSRRPDADLEAELEKLKLELDRLATVARPAAGDSTPAPDEPEPNDDRPDDHGQKEVIFGNISEETIQYATVNRTQVGPATERQNATPTDRTQSDESTQTTVAEPTTDQTTEGPPKPEIDYSDVGEAVKLISRYADVATDDTFKGERKRPSDEAQLGTRTRQQHRRKPAGAFANLHAPPPPPPSIYADRLPAHLAYPHYPPPDYPFRHVQQYWSHPEQFLGPYAHNPRRHHHAYPRRPAPPSADARDLYHLLALRHWFSGDAAADR